MKKFSLIVIAAIVAVGVCGLGAWWYVNAPYSGAEPAWVYLPAGTTKAALSDSLEARLGDKTASKVMRIYSALANDSTPPHGAYRIDPGTPAKSIANRIAKGRQTPVKVTINNVRTLDQLGERMAGCMEFTAEQWDDALKDVLPANGFTTREQYIAAFLPDTYEFYWTAEPEQVAQKMLDVRNRFWDDSRRAQAAALGLNPVKVATICSIAEEETNKRDERATVGRLYLNRVRKGMKLQADPTVKFALGDFSLRRIRSNHLKVESPYNTYRVAGLPPGPIRMAERQTMEDFLNEPDNNYIYMCAKEDFSGRHNFASDYATHQANARRYQQALNNRGIK